MLSQRPIFKASRQGFALIVTLVLLALMIAIIFATALLLRTDTEIGVESRFQEEAKQNAILGFRTALGELQTYAGKDEVATGRADILMGASGESFAHPYWTGVWAVDDATSEVGDPHWLVSRTGTGEPDPKQTGSGSNLSILSTHHLIDAQGESVEKIALKGTDNQTRGEMAYWVSDEGVKMNMMTSEPQSQIDAGNAANPTNEAQMVELRRRTKLTRQGRWEKFIKTNDITNTADANINTFPRITEDAASRLITRENVTFLTNSLADGLPSFHNLTPYSMGLLTKTTEGGGLKEDLTRILKPGYSGVYGDASPVLSGSEFGGTSPTWGLLRSYYNLGTDLGAIDKLEPEVSVRPQTATQQGVYPIIGMVQLNWRLYAEKVGDPFQMTIQPIVTLINPTTVRLANVAYEVDFEYVDGGEIEIVVEDKDGNESTLGPYTLTDLFGSPLRMNIPVTNKVFLPGEARLFGLKNNGTTGVIDLELGIANISGKYWSHQLTDTLPADSDVRLVLKKGTIQLTLKLGTSIPLQEVQGVASNPASIDVDPLDRDGGTIANRVALRTVDMDQVGKSGVGGLRWLSLFNIRAPINDIPPGTWDGNPLYSAWEPSDPSIQTYPVTSAAYRTYWAQSNKVVYPDPGADGSPQQINLVFAPLFDVPRDEIISIASLQHANLADKSWYPSGAVGNSYASPFFGSGTNDLSYALNKKLFDNFFFSGLSQSSAWPQRDSLLNTHLVFLKDKPEADSFDANHIAAYIGLRGAFNVNSTSNQAWYALLAGLHGVDFPIFSRENSNANTFSANGFKNLKPDQFPLLVPVLRHDMTLATGTGTSYRQLWLGGRVLSPSLFTAFINSPTDKLGIRDRMYQRKKPYASVSEFINRDRTNMSGATNAQLSGILQQAADSKGGSMASTTYFTGYDPEATYAPAVAYADALKGVRSIGRPGWITQADILGPIAPLLTTRSDTFVIRAYGSVLNPESQQVEAEAWCEAVVQRFPDYLNTNDAAYHAPTEPENQKFGRRFRVVSFRWLNKDEI